MRPAARSRSGPLQGRAPGFTLLEMIFMLLIMGALGAVTLSRLTDSHADLIGRAEVLRSHIRYAQALAMNTGRSWGLRFDPASNVYWLFFCDAPPCAAAANRAVLPGSEPDAQSRVDLGDINLQWVREGATDVDTLVFDSMGRPFRDTDASLQLPLAANLRLRLRDSGGELQTIVVMTETGYVR